MYQRSPLPIRQEELPVTQNDISTESNDKSYNLPQIYINDNTDLSSVEPDQSVEMNYQSKSKLNLDPKFLIICIVFLLVLLAVVGFVGYWIISKNNQFKCNSKTNKRREGFITMFLLDMEY